jgi:hypothetical protein
VAVLTRFAVDAPTRVALGDRTAFFVRGFDARGSELRFDGVPYDVTVGGAVERAHPKGCMDISATGDAFDAISVGAGRIEARMGALSARADVEVFPRP